MNNKLENKKIGEVSYLGVGPKIFICISPFILIFGIISFILEPFFRIPIDLVWILLIGTIFLSTGIILFIYSEINLRKAFKESDLLTTHASSYIRHPMYASMGLGMLPGIFILLNSWLLLLILPIYYLLVRFFIREEEAYLVKKFGSKYLHYKEKMNAFFPNFKKYKFDDS